MKPLSRKAAQIRGALCVYLQPKLAQDAAINLRAIVADVNSKNYEKKIPEITDRLNKACAGKLMVKTEDNKLAQDADIGDVTELLDALKDVEEEEQESELMEGEEDDEGIDAETDPNSAAGGHGKAREFLAGKLSAEDMKTYDEMMGPQMEPKDTHDAGLEDEKDMKAGEDEDKEEKKEEDKPVSKGAMDAAIADAVAKATKATEARVLANQRAIHEAVRDVRPYIGEVTMAHDSAEAVYKLALDTLNVDVEGVPPAAYKKFLKAQPVPGSKNQKKSDSKMAEDAAASSGFLARFPDAARIGNL